MNESNLESVASCILNYCTLFFCAPFFMCYVFIVQFFHYPIFCPILRSLHPLLSSSFSLTCSSTVFFFFFRFLLFHVLFFIFFFLVFCILLHAMFIFVIFFPTTIIVAWIFSILRVIVKKLRTTKYVRSSVASEEVRYNSDD